MEEMPTATFSEFEYALVRKATAERKPIFCSFEITSRCNLRCTHCYIPLEHRKKIDHNFQELSFQEVCRILDEITDAGCFGIKFTGGEIFVRKDFLDIYRYAKSKGLLVNLYTNGTLINSSIVNVLEEWRPMLVEISLYGATEATYEKITGIKGSFSRCINSIHLLNEAGVNILLKTPIFSYNKHEIHLLKNFADSIGIDIILSPDIVARLDSDSEPCELNLPINEIVKFKISDLSTDKNASMKKRLGYKSNSLFTCSAGKCSFHVSSDGFLHPCVLYRTSGFNLVNNKFSDGWDVFLKNITDRKLSPQHRCASCSFRRICDNCPGKALLNTRSDTCVVDFYCTIAHEIAKVGHF